MTHARSRQGRWWAAFAALIGIASVFALSNASSAHAEELQFCWGKNFKATNNLSESLCFSGKYNLGTVYASGVSAPVCAGAFEITGACETKANTGVWVEHINGAYTNAYIWNKSSLANKAYGKLWTAPPPPPPSPPKRVDELGFLRYNQASGKAHLDSYTGAPGYATLAASADTAESAISDPQNVQSVALDTNGDGYRELAVIRFNASGSTHVNVYSGAPNYKTLLASCNTGYPEISDPQNVQAMALDTNGDGISELAFVRLNSASGYAHIDAYFGAPCYQQLEVNTDLPYPSISDPQNVHALPIDVNGDGIDELMFLRYNYAGNAQAVTYHGAPYYSTLLSNCTTGFPSLSNSQNMETFAIDTDGNGTDELGFLNYSYFGGHTQLLTYSSPSCYTTLASNSETGYPSISDFGNVQGLAINTNGS